MSANPTPETSDNVTSPPENVGAEESQPTPEALTAENAEEAAGKALKLLPEPQHVTVGAVIVDASDIIDAPPAKDDTVDVSDGPPPPSQAIAAISLPISESRGQSSKATRSPWTDRDEITGEVKGEAEAEAATAAGGDVNANDDKSIDDCNGEEEGDLSAAPWRKRLWRGVGRRSPSTVDAAISSCGSNRRSLVVPILPTAALAVLDKTSDGGLLPPSERRGAAEAADTAVVPATAEDETCGACGEIVRSGPTDARASRARKESRPNAAGSMAGNLGRGG